MICTLIWGSTWLVITYQLEGASPVVSVFYRFLLSAVILFIICAVARTPLRYSWKKHCWFIAQGIFMFSLNYMLTYKAEELVSSGLIAVTFTFLLYFNILGTRLLFKTPVARNVLIGAGVGALGIGLIFLREILNFDSGSKTIVGLIFGTVATLFASCGNLMSYKHRENKVPIMASNAYGMLYGSLFTLCLALLLDETFQVLWTTKFILSLAYLSIFGSVIAFGAYLSLVGRIGAEKAAYTSVINPIIALILSSFFESFRWSLPVTIGIIFCLLGNIITLWKPKKRATV